MDRDSELLMEFLLARCLTLPGRQVEAAIEQACRTHPKVARQLRCRYYNLLQMGILESHEDESQTGESRC